MISDRHMAELALVQNLLSPERLDEARQHQRRHGGALYDVLIENRFVEEEPTITAVAQVLTIPCVSLRDFQADPVLLKLIPVELASLHRVVPLGIEESATGPQIFLAMANPIDVNALEELAESTHRQVVAFLAGPLDIAQTLERLYGSAIYKARASLDALFGGARTPARDQSFGPSVSQLLEMPMLPAEEESMRLESLQHVHDDFASSSAASEDNGMLMDMTHLGIEPMADLHEPMTAPLQEEDLHNSIVSMSDLLGDDELDLLLEGGEDSLLGDTFSLMEQPPPKKAADKEGLFTVSASKIFMRPGSLSDISKHRTPPTATLPNDGAKTPPGKAPPRVGTFRQIQKVTTEEELARPMKRLEPLEPSADLDPLQHFGFGAPSSFQQAREATQRAAPALSMDALASQGPSPLSSLEASPALESYEELDLLRALVRALLKRGVISEHDLHEAMREMTSPDSLL